MKGWETVHLQAVGKGVHDLSLLHKVELKADLLGKFIHWRYQVKFEFCVLH